MTVKEIFTTRGMTVRESFATCGMMVKESFAARGIAVISLVRRSALWLLRPAFCFRHSARSRGISLALLLIASNTAALAAVESVEIRSRLDPNAIEITGVDVLFLYDEATMARIPATKSAWYGNRRTLTTELGEAFDLVSTFIPQGFDSARLNLPGRAAEAIRVLVFAEHGAADAPPVNITEMTSVLIEIDPFGIRVSGE